MNASDQPSPVPPAPRVRLPVKPLIVFAVLSVGLLLIYLSPLRAHLQDVRAVKAQLRALGGWGPVLYMAVVYVLVALGVPRLLFCPLGGMAFGFCEGLLWTQIPTLLGYYTTFLFVRWGGRDFTLRHWRQLDHLRSRLTGPAIPTVILVRQLPISGLITNLFLGLAPIRHRDFLIGTLVGILPEAIPFTLVASGAVKLGGGESFGYIGGATILLVVVWLGLWYLARRSAIFASLRGELREIEGE
jgi:uncharacterized membrane protein YdjX (TVP38/TMEM64 family)